MFIIIIIINFSATQNIINIPYNIYNIIKYYMELLRVLKGDIQSVARTVDRVTYEGQK